ncbi:hypothetical protein BDF19DRAFT_409973 [Syncephalis fuscata]|nr:hypothetical protein BDF19DRAFT_409973 [Syncephalis fuscata]
MASMSPSGNTPVVLASSHPMQQSPSQQHGATSKLNENTDSSTTTSHQSPTNNSPYIKASNAVSDSAVIDSHNSNNGKVSAGVSIPVPAHVYQPNAPSRPGPMASSSSPSLPLSVNTAISMPMPQPVTANYPYTVNPVPPTSFPVPMTAALTQGSSNESPSLSMPHPTSTGQSSPILSFSTTNPPSPTFPSPHPQQHRRQFSNEYRPVTNAPSMVASYDPSAYTGRTAYTSYTRTVTPPTTLQDDRSVYPASTDAIYHGSSRATDSILSREAFSIPSIRSREEEPERHSLYPASTDGLYQGSSRAPSLPDEVKE